jgi:hypothetical protein
MNQNGTFDESLIIDNQYNIHLINQLASINTIFPFTCLRLHLLCNQFGPQLGNNDQQIEILKYYENVTSLTIEINEIQTQHMNFFSQLSNLINLKTLNIISRVHTTSSTCSLASFDHLMIRSINQLPEQIRALLLQLPCSSSLSICFDSTIQFVC